MGAGETGSESDANLLSTVYPRGCGGNWIRAVVLQMRQGLSPWVRGKLTLFMSGLLAVGSIPVGAGETPQSPAETPRGWVYPRGCGGNFPGDGDVWGGDGLSPWVRGKQLLAKINDEVKGSIPVGAGETPRRHGF